MDTKDSGTKTLMAVLSYFGLLILIPLLTEAKNDPFVKFHVQQGLIFLICSVVVSFLYWIPVVGWLLGVFLFVIFIIGVINAATGRKVLLPIIGKYGAQIKI